jgi:hypothetical protein
LKSQFQQAIQVLATNQQHEHIDSSQLLSLSRMAHKQLHWFLYRLPNHCFFAKGQGNKFEKALLINLI